MAGKVEIKHKGKVSAIAPEGVYVEILNKSMCAECHARALCSLGDEQIKTVLIKYCDKSQYETSNEIIWNHKAASYQQYQGQKLVRRFDAYSYLSMLNLTDSHNIGRGRGGVETALNMINANVICVGIDSDILFPSEEQKYIASHVKNGIYREITSLYGHDGFLLEWKQIANILKEIL